MAFVYKGLKIQYHRHMITQEEIDRNMQRLVEQNPRVREVTDRPARNGDEVVLDYAGFCDGVQFEGGTAQDQTLVLGSGMFIPGFEEQLIGTTPGQTVTVKVTFPKPYHSEELAGREAQFQCTVKAIRQKTPYQLDDTFAKEVGQCESLEAMREKMGQSLQVYTDERGEMDLQDQLLKMAADSLDFTYTEEMMEKALEEQVRNMRAQLSQQGLTLEMYCQFMNTTLEKLKEDARPSAEAAMRSKAAIDQVVKLEGLEATQEDILKALEVICRHNNITMEQLREQYEPAFEDLVINSVLTGKVMRLIRDAAVVEEV